ncbi:MAG: dethiobiotin synthase [Marinilabiliales bacterium]|nr:MAG: dethiobiotin synthase [Marinilabiliales bacterium]
MSKQFYISAIGTDSGKSLASAILCRHLNAAYYKPIQSGPDHDSTQIHKWLNGNVEILPEAYKLTQPMSPHIAAEKDGLEITEKDLSLPKYDGNLVVESAGGLMVPINTKGLIMADLAKMWKLPVILVINHYLGAINHSLLSLEYCNTHDIEVAGIIFNGTDNLGNEGIILWHYPLPIILRIPQLEQIDETAIDNLAKEVKL